MSNVSWAQKFNVPTARLEEWRNEAGSQDLLSWCLLNGKISESQYLQWACRHFELPIVESNYFALPPDHDLWERVQKESDWNSHLIPVHEWEGILLIACVEPVPLKLNRPHRFVLAPASSLNFLWTTLGHSDVAQKTVAVPVLPVEETIAPSPTKFTINLGGGTSVSKVSPATSVSTVSPVSFAAPPLLEMPEDIIAESGTVANAEIPLDVLEDSVLEPTHSGIEIEMPEGFAATSAGSFSFETPESLETDIEAVADGAAEEASEEAPPEMPDGFSFTAPASLSFELTSSSSSASALAEDLSEVTAPGVPTETAPGIEVPTETAPGIEIPEISFAVPPMPKPVVATAPPPLAAKPEIPSGPPAIPKIPPIPKKAEPVVAIVPPIPKKPEPVVAAAVAGPPPIIPAMPQKAPPAPAAAASLVPPKMAIPVPAPIKEKHEAPGAIKPKAPTPNVNVKSVDIPQTEGAPLPSRPGVTDFNQCHSYEEATDLAFSQMKGIFQKGVMLVFQSGQLRPWKWTGNVQYSGRGKPSYIELSEASIFRIPYNTSLPYHGYVTPNPINDAFFKEFNAGATPKHVTIMPLRVGGNIAGMLMGASDEPIDLRISLRQMEGIAENVSQAFSRIRGSKAA